MPTKKEQPFGKKGKSEEIATFRERVEELVDSGYQAIMPYQGLNGCSVTMPETFDISTGRENLMIDSAQPQAIGGVVMQGSVNLFNNKQSNPQPIDNVGTKGLGYIPWGPNNDLPNNIFLLGSSLPYTSAALKYLIDITVSLGPAVMYKWARYAGGTVKEELIPFEHAGVLISGRMREVESEIYETTSANGDNSLIESLQREKERLQKDYKEWERSWKEIKKFIENNNLELHYQKCMTDDAHLDIYFPTIGLNKGRVGKWKAKIESIGHIPAVCARMEQMDVNWKINYVYYAEKWRKDATQALLNKDAVAYDALMPEHLLSDLRKKVDENQNTSPGRRPTWFCCPSYYPSMLRPYYPQPAWWSIFSSRVYDYASTLIYDKAIARQNSTMFGKMIFINLSYLKQLFDQRGADTPDDQQKIINDIHGRINQFLQVRGNNGKGIFLDSFLSQDEKTLWKSIEIVDVPQPSNGADTKTELEEISSIIFFAMGIHPALIGAIPGKSGSSGGTFQRELQLLKQMQVSPRQRIYLRFLQSISTFNEWDSHAVWVIKEQVLTTLDRNKNGVEESESK